MNLSAGIFGERFPSTADAPLFPGFTGDEDTTFAARAGWAPINRETNGVLQVLHIGGASGTARPATISHSSSTDPMREAPIFIWPMRRSTPAAIGDEDTFWGLEAAALWGPFSIQGEYARLDVDLPGGPFIRATRLGGSRAS